MRDLLNLFQKHYSAVNISDGPNNNCSAEENLEHLQKIGFNAQHRKSLQSTRPLRSGLSIVDSFFSKRTAGKRYPKCAFLLLAAGLCAIASAIGMYIFQPYDAIFKWKLLFAENGEIFNLWKTPPVNLYIKIYLFNITNVDEFLRGEEKMRVEEVGPYVYRELLSHDEIVFNNNGTLSTIPHHPLVWNEELSMGNREDDIFMLPNIALLSIAQVASDKNYFFRLPINMVIRQTNSQPIVKMTAKEFMFGYESPLTTLGNQFLPDWIYFDKVGLIDRMYDFSGDFETFYTGETNYTISGLYDTFLGSKNLKQWDGDHCSNINGASDGTKFKSFIEPDEQLLFFRKSMCRPQRVIRVGNETNISGLSSYKYVFENNAMDNGEIDERNKCFCRNGQCLPAGLLDISDCYYGFPIALSYPHFLDTDQKVFDQVEGVQPNRSDHESYFMIQPGLKHNWQELQKVYQGLSIVTDTLTKKTRKIKLESELKQLENYIILIESHPHIFVQLKPGIPINLSGLPLELKVKFQINMAMRDVSNMAHVEKFSNIVIPMLWFEITLHELPESLKSRFSLYLNILPAVEIVGRWLLLVGGIISLLIAVTRVSLQLSQGLQPSHKISKHRKYTSVYQDTIQRIDDCDKVYEMNEKDKLGEMDKMFEIDLNSENKYMLEDEPALSDGENDSDEGDGVSSPASLLGDSSGSAKVSENDSFHTTSADTVQLYTDWKMGPSSSAINDIDRDDFHEVLHIEEDQTDGNVNQHSAINVDDPISTFVNAQSEESISSILEKV